MYSKHAANRNFSRISVRLSIAVTAILMFAFAVNLAASISDNVVKLDEEYAEEAASIIDTANIAVGNRTNFGMGDYLQQLCKQLVSTDPELLNVSISTVKRNAGMVVVASSDEKMIGLKNDSSYYSVINKEQRILDDKSEAFTELRKLKVLGPLYSDGRPVAVISVEVNFASRDKDIQRLLIESSIRTLLLLMLISLLLYLLMRIEVFKPLWQLANDAKEIARGNFKRRSLINSNNEIGELAREFNLLAMFLQQRQEENERLLKSVKEKWAKAEAKSQTDFLTNLENHRSFQDRLATELERANRNDQMVSLLFCDLDKFKLFNDTNGHPLGDKALFDVARIIRQSIRTYDIAARYGGEEFAVILPSADTEEAVMIAERIRQNVAMHLFTVEGGLGNMTISIGVATFPNDAQVKEMLITSADYAMYESKKLRGNTVTVFTSFGGDASKKVS